MLRNFIVSSPCFELGIAQRTGRDLLKSVKRPARKARPLLVTSNDALRNRQVKRSFFRPGREAISSLRHPCCQSYPIWRWCKCDFTATCTLFSLQGNLPKSAFATGDQAGIDHLL